MTGYRKVTVEELPNTPNPTTAKREVDEAVGATAFGFNVYTAAPGERLPWGRHRHPDHEELLYVLAGELVVETAEGEVHLEPDDAFFVPPDHPNLARAVGEKPARVVAIGAPKDRDGAVIEEACPACGEVTDREYAVVPDGDAETYVLSCAACGAETDRFG